MKKDSEENILYDENEKKSNSFFRKLFFVIVLIISLTVVYAKYIGTSGLILKDYYINNENIPNGYTGFKIAHFSDFHYNKVTGMDKLKTLVKKVNETKPDLIVFTGDFIDKNYSLTDSEATNITNELTKMNSTYGKYFITGNHDVKCKSYNKIFEDANFISLDDTYELIFNKNNEAILLAGLNNDSNGLWLNDVIQKHNVSYKILLMHKPDTFDDIKQYNFNLVLAGHSHNGQIRLPIYGAILTPKGAKKYYKPHYKIDNTDMYISSGIGNTVIDYRLFNRPSFNIYRLNKIGS